MAIHLGISLELYMNVKCQFTQLSLKLPLRITTGLSHQLRLFSHGSMIDAPVA